MSRCGEITTGLNYVASVLKSECNMKVKCEKAIQASKEASFWHFNDTGICIIPFESFEIRLSGGYTVPEFDSENAHDKRYTLYLYCNDEILKLIYEKMKHVYNTPLELISGVVLNNQYEEIWKTIKEIKLDIIKKYKDEIKKLENEQEELKNRIKRLESVIY